MAKASVYRKTALHFQTAPLPGGTIPKRRGWGPVISSILQEGHDRLPELPEVETVLRSIRPHVVGRRILDASFSSRRVMREDAAAASSLLRGRSIRSIERRGKFLVFDMDGVALTIHLGMTGRLLWNGVPGPYTRARFWLVEGELLYDDVRQFGRIEVSERLPTRLARLGPEPLEIGVEEFTERLRSRRCRVKPLLLNQTFLRGLGNIYADEALFRARIHPRAEAGRLSAARARALHGAIQGILRAAIASGGSSISDYVDGDGRKGWFQTEHCVYGRTGEPCVACGIAIRRIVLAQRGTHFCPHCQRR
ncbi:MAG: bifunctional DNA-formamidopyrimidine glycosylase/DNA-(apurinic or apyrimidinic site) lyase [Bryobacteraceae bacterium]